MVGKLTPDNIVSASLIPIIMGVGNPKGKTQNDLIRAMRSARGLELSLGIEAEPNRAAKEAMLWGNLLEPVIVDEAARRIGCHARPVNRPLYYHHKDFDLPLIGASLDGELLPKGNHRSS